MTVSDTAHKAMAGMPSDLVHVYVWQWPVRITHWFIAISIWVLSVTGIYMGYPLLLASGAASDNFLMGWAKLIHFYAAMVFSLSVISRAIWGFFGNRYANWDKFVPVRRKRYKGIIPTLRFYLFNLRLPPGFLGHNPLAGMTYLVVYVFFVIQILTGLAMYGASAAYDSPFRMFAGLLPLIGGLQTAHYVHHVVMWFIWMFFVHHVYSAIAMSQIEGTGTMESIFSGWKFVPREDLVYSGYRFKDVEKKERA